MKLKKIKLFLGVLLLYSCTTEYTELVRDELSTGIRQDSLFLGFQFGDSREEFFSKGWALNKKGLVMQGPGNMTVQYIMAPQDTLGSPLRLLFYPSFDADKKIKEMEVTFDYTAWAPWSKRFSSDSLLVAVKDTLMNWYGGNQFIRVDIEDESFKYLWVKVDGNRRIVIHKKNEKDIFGKISDLTNEEVMKKNNF